MSGLMYPGGNGKIKGVTRLARGSVGNNEYVGINTTISDRKYKAFLLFIGQTTNVNPSINLSSGNVTKFENLYFDGYSGGSHFTINVGWLYLITNFKYPLTVKVDYYPQTYGNRNASLWGIY